ncbi:MAG TPA: diguanylate phosphodiesterase, partial [Micromonosporaceae bacterium]|nr:diguanylate phosphodiesterase [Micromonosporaceae bacterium]
MNTSTGGLAGDRGDTRAGRASREFFELLAKEASAADFDAPVTAAQERGGSAAEVAELQQDRADALKVRAILRRRARRETELAALFDTAHDLATLRDPEAVLEAIVHRVRRLLATDVAYLSLTDEERGDNYLRVAAGLTSAR